MDFFNNIGKDLTNPDKYVDSITNIEDPFDADRKPWFNFFGITDISFIQFFLGLLFGLFARDVHEEWSHCMGGPLLLFRDTMKDVFILIGQDWTDILGVLGNLTLLGDFFSLGLRAVTEIPGDIAACTGIYTEASESIGFIIKLLNPATLLTNLGTNALTHIMDIINDLWQITISAFTFKFYDLGKYIGMLTMSLLA